MALSPDIQRAIVKYAPLYDRQARSKYGISGRQLLAKLITGESGGRANAESKAGARGRAQFMPGTRAIAIEKYGIDPWRSADEAVHAAVLHLQGKLTGAKGLEGYNPGGGQQYVHYILGQNVEIPKNGGSVKRNINGPPPIYANTSVRTKDATENFDKAGYQDALRKALLARLLENRPGGSVLLRTGLISPEIPQRGDFLSTTPKHRTVGVGPGALAEGGRGAATGLSGRVRITGSNPRRLKRPVIRFLHELAGITGQTITGDSGASHSKFTVNGNVSQHFTGDAVDIPASGKELIRLGQEALIIAGMSPKEARKQKGGLYNVNGHQVIFNTYEGGNHTNHLHYGD